MSRIRLKDTNKCLEVDANTLSGNTGGLTISECCIPNLHQSSTMASYCGTNSTQWSVLKDNVSIKNIENSQYLNINGKNVENTTSKNNASKWILESSLDSIVPIGGIWIPVIMFTYDNNPSLVTWENSTLKVNTSITINNFSGTTSESLIESATIWIKEEGGNIDKAPFTGKNPNYENYSDIAIAKINPETTLANEDGSGGYNQSGYGICKVHSDKKITCSEGSIGQNKFKIKSYNELDRIPLNNTALNFTIYDCIYYLKSPDKKSICVNSNNYLDNSFGNTGETDDERSLYYIIPINPNSKQLFGFHLDKDKIHGDQTFMLKPARNMTRCVNNNLSTQLCNPDKSLNKNILWKMEGFTNMTLGNISKTFKNIKENFNPGNAGQYGSWKKCSNEGNTCNPEIGGRRIMRGRKMCRKWTYKEPKYVRTPFFKTKFCNKDLCFPTGVKCKWKKGKLKCDTKMSCKTTRIPCGVDRWWVNVFKGYVDRNRSKCADLKSQEQGIQHGYPGYYSSFSCGKTPKSLKRGTYKLNNPGSLEITHNNKSETNISKSDISGLTDSGLIQNDRLDNSDRGTCYYSSKEDPDGPVNPTTVFIYGDGVSTQLTLDLTPYKIGNYAVQDGWSIDSSHSDNTNWSNSGYNAILTSTSDKGTNIGKTIVKFTATDGSIISNKRFKIRIYKCEDGLDGCTTTGDTTQDVVGDASYSPETTAESAWISYDEIENFTNMKEGYDNMNSFASGDNNTSTMQKQLDVLEPAIEKIKTSHNANGWVAGYDQYTEMETEVAAIKMKLTLYREYRFCYIYLSLVFFSCRSPYADGIDPNNSEWYNSLNNTLEYSNQLTGRISSIIQTFHDVSKDAEAENIKAGITNFIDVINLLNTPEYRKYINIFYSYYDLDSYSNQSKNIYYTYSAEGSIEDVEEINKLINSLDEKIELIKNMGNNNYLLFELSSNAVDNITINLNNFSKILIDFNAVSSDVKNNMLFLGNKNSFNLTKESVNSNKTGKWDNTYLVNILYPNQKYGMLHVHRAYLTSLRAIVFYNVSLFNFKNVVNIKKETHPIQAQVANDFIDELTRFIIELVTDFQEFNNEYPEMINSTQEIIENENFNKIRENLISCVNAPIDNISYKMITCCFKNAKTNDLYTELSCPSDVNISKNIITKISNNKTRLDESLNKYYKPDFLITKAYHILCDHFKNGFCEAYSKPGGILEQIATNIKDFMNQQKDIPKHKAELAISGLYSDKPTQSIEMNKPGNETNVISGIIQSFEAFTNRKKKKEGFGTKKYVATNIKDLLNSGDQYTTFNNYVTNRLDRTTCSVSSGTPAPLFNASYNCGTVLAEENDQTISNIRSGDTNIKFDCTSNSGNDDRWGCNNIVLELKDTLDSNGSLTATVRIIQKGTTPEIEYWKKSMTITVPEPYITKMTDNYAKNGKNNVNYLKFGEILRNGEYIGSPNGYARIQNMNGNIHLCWTEDGCVSKSSGFKSSLKKYGRTMEDITPHAVFSALKDNNPIANLKNVGKIGYVSENGVLQSWSDVPLDTTFDPNKHVDFSPVNNVGVYSDDYTYVGTYTYGGTKNNDDLGTIAEIPDVRTGSALTVNGGPEKCEIACNNDVPGCAGFITAKTGSDLTCMFLNDQMYPKGLRKYSPDRKMYIRNKKYDKDKMNVTCNKEVENINSRTWQNFIDTDSATNKTMDKSSKCGLAYAVRNYPTKENSYLLEYENATNNLENTTIELSQELASLSEEEKKILDDMGISIHKLDKDVNDYKHIKKEFNRFTKEQEKMDASTKETTDNLTRTNYLFILSGILIILLLVIVIRLVYKKSVPPIVALPIIGIFILLLKNT